MRARTKDQHLRSIRLARMLARSGIFQNYEAEQRAVQLLDQLELAADPELQQAIDDQNAEDADPYRYDWFNLNPRKQKRG